MKAVGSYTKAKLMSGLKAITSCVYNKNILIIIFKKENIY